MGNNNSINEQPTDWASKSTESERLRQIRSAAPSCSAQAAVCRRSCKDGGAAHEQRRGRKCCTGGGVAGGAARVAAQHGRAAQQEALHKRRLLVFCNVTNKIRKRTDTAVTFTQEYSRISYPLRNVSTLSTGSGSSKDRHAGVEKTEERTFCI